MVADVLGGGEVGARRRALDIVVKPAVLEHLITLSEELPAR